MESAGTGAPVTTSQPTSQPVWLFGYGSLIWRVNFPYQQKVVGYVRGYMRRFWQGSVVHRGTPAAPGRVVTLIETEGEETWGISYKVHPEDIPETIAYLNHREGDGYRTQEVEFYPANGDQFTLRVLVYIATEKNPHYLGPANVESLAEHIVHSKGASGCNVEYVLELAKALREIAPHIEDTHLFELEAKIKEMVREKRVNGTEKFCTCTYWG